MPVDQEKLARLQAAAAANKSVWPLRIKEYGYLKAEI